MKIDNGMPPPTLVQGTTLQADALPNDSRLARPDAQAAQQALTPAAIYHGQEPYSAPSNGPRSNIEVYAEVLDTDLEARQASQVFQMITWDLGKATGDLRYAYEASLKQLHPALVAKDWGFSVSNGQITLSEGADKLTEGERQAIRQAFSDNGIESFSRSVADTMITAIEYERNGGRNDVSNSIGQYDVTQKNFGDIVDLREYLESHAEGGKYGRDVIDPTDYSRLYRITGGFAMMEQIAAKAVARYAKA